jgi:hypothetical protein
MYLVIIFCCQIMYNARPAPPHGVQINNHCVLQQFLVRGIGLSHMLHPNEVGGLEM